MRELVQILGAAFVIPALIVLAILCAAAFILSLKEYVKAPKKYKCTAKRVRMRFKEFLPLYRVAPKEWKFYESYAVRTVPIAHYISMTDDYLVIFPLRDYFRVTRFRNRIERQKAEDKERKRKREEKEDHMELLKLAQADIDRLRAQGEQEIQEAKETTERVQESYGGYKSVSEHASELFGEDLFG